MAGVLENTCLNPAKQILELPHLTWYGASWWFNSCKGSFRSCQTNFINTKIIWQAAQYIVDLGLSSKQTHLSCSCLENSSFHRSTVPCQSLTSQEKIMWVNMQRPLEEDRKTKVKKRLKIVLDGSEDLVNRWSHWPKASLGPVEHGDVPRSFPCPGVRSVVMSSR